MIDPFSVHWGDGRPRQRGLPRLDRNPLSEPLFANAAFQDLRMAMTPMRRPTTRPAARPRSGSRSA
jgi:hypothetical protein